ncbi:MAG TPA: tRNA lysidine(34) synthetase TilS [Planctomycetota bacterium]|nr:tRNA lysidine(34) synthetase TilS [Planctomycetota bacterium]
MDSHDRLLDLTARCLSRYENLTGDKTVLAAISGGVDSTVLALVLAHLHQDGRLPGPLYLCHVDHGVRPDSRAVAQHVVELADQLSVPVLVRRLTFAAVHPSEDALRRGRYEALQSMAAECGAGMVITAHHADDNLETVLFRMLRGTGPRGLAGIPEARWLRGATPRILLVRPFLKTRRSTLEHLLAALGHQAHEDSSNQDLSYARNRLRLETIPQLRQQLGVGLDVALMTVTRTARNMTEILEAHGLRLLSARARHRTAWRTELDLRGLSDAARPFVEEALRQAHSTIDAYGRAPLQAWLDRALALLDKPTGKRVQGRGGLLIERTRSGLLLLDPDRAGTPPNTGDGGQLLLWDAGRQRFGATEWWLEANEHPQPPLVPSPSEAGRDRALLDPRALPSPWRLRTRRPGDRFQPLGCTRPLELRRFLQSRHLPRFDRDRLPLLVDALDRVLWIPGVEVSELAKLQLNTRRTIEVRIGSG